MMIDDVSYIIFRLTICLCIIGVMYKSVAIYPVPPSKKVLRPWDKTSFSSVQTEGPGNVRYMMQTWKITLRAVEAVRIEITKHGTTTVVMFLKIFI